LNSFEVISSKNPFHTKTLTEHKDNVFARCDGMMNKNGGIVAGPWILLQEGYALNPEIIYFIEYENLCKEPEKTMRSVYEFLEKPYYSHDFENLEYSNENFDKACNLKNLHTVKKRVEYNPPRNVLPPEIVKKYKEMNMEFWRANYKPDTDIIEKLDKKFIEYK
jgi:sulfotransferase